MKKNTEQASETLSRLPSVVKDIVYPIEKEIELYQKDIRSFSKNNAASLKKITRYNLNSADIQSCEKTVEQLTRNSYYRGPDSYRSKILEARRLLDAGNQNSASDLKLKADNEIENRRNPFSFKSTFGATPDKAK